MVTDAQPGTVPAWAIRYASRETEDGGREWLVLGDPRLAAAEHPECKYRDRFLNYGVWRVLEWYPSECGCPGALNCRISRPGDYFDSLPEAEAAFAAAEREWLR